MGPDDVSAGMLALIASSAKWSSETTQGVFTQLAQLGGQVGVNLMHQHGGTGDDPGLIAALQTAAGVPRQGAISA